jgi:hypothetical protein
MGLLMERALYNCRLSWVTTLRVTRALERASALGLGLRRAEMGKFYKKLQSHRSELRAIIIIVIIIVIIRVNTTAVKQPSTALFWVDKWWVALPAYVQFFRINILDRSC